MNLPLSKLLIFTVKAGLSFPVLMALWAVCALGGGMFAATYENPNFSFFARVQVSSLFLFFVLFVFLQIQISNFTEFAKTNGLILYHRAKGEKNAQIFFSILLAAFLLFLFFCVFHVILVMVSSIGSGQTFDSLLVNLQQMMLLSSPFLSVTAINISFSKIFSSSAGFFTALTIALLGIFGYWIVGIVVSSGVTSPLVSSILDFLWGVLPHFYLADLTNRITYGWGAIPAISFLKIFGYLLFLASLFTLLGYEIFKSKE